MFVLYGLTANRGPQWQDSGHHIVRILTGEWINPGGLALSHPLHHLLGRLAVAPGLLEPSLATTLISALAAALAVANVYGCVRAWKHDRSAALVAALSLAFAHTFWQLATLTETYTPAVALLSAECWALIAFLRTQRPSRLGLAIFFNGLGVSNHMQAALSTPILIVVAGLTWRRRRAPSSQIMAWSGVWLLGASPYLLLVVTEAIRTGDVFAAAHSALFGKTFAGAVLNVTPSWHQLLIVVGFLIYNFPNLSLPLAAYGATSRLKEPADRAVRGVLLAYLLVHALFVARYNIVDQHTFMLPTYTILALFVGAGWARLSHLRDPRRARPLRFAAAVLLLATPIVYMLTPPLARKWKILDGGLHEKPYRDDYVYLLSPWSLCERSAERMSKEALKLAGQGGVIIVEDPMAVYAVRYQLLRSGASNPLMDKKLNDDDLTAIRDTFASTQPVILVPRNRNHPDTPPPIGSWRRAGDLYILEPAQNVP